MSKKRLEDECLATVGLYKITGSSNREMIRKLNLYGQKVQRQKKKEGCLDADVCETKEDSENETNTTDSNEGQMQLALILIRAEERRSRRRRKRQAI